MEKYDYNPEKLIKGAHKPVDIATLEIIMEQSKKSVCKINCKDGTGTGFFCLIPFPDKTERLRTLMTNNHVLGEADIVTGKKIEFSINNEEKKFEIVINERRKVYTNEEYDITIIEIKKADGLRDDSFLEVDEPLYKDEINLINFKNKSIYLLHYPKGEKINHSAGVIEYIDSDNYNIRHLCSTDSGSSGSPILNLLNNRLIGIHKGELKTQEINLGTLLKLPIEKFNEKYKNDENNAPKNSSVLAVKSVVEGNNEKKIDIVQKVGNKKNLNPKEDNKNINICKIDQKENENKNNGYKKIINNPIDVEPKFKKFEGNQNKIKIINNEQKKTRK